MTATEPAAMIAADDIASAPDTADESTPERWLRHLAAQAAACYAASTAAVHQFSDVYDRPDVDTDIGKRLACAVGAGTHAGHGYHIAALLMVRLISENPHAAAEVARHIWEITPEAGALNGEWVDDIDELLATFNIDAALIEPLSWFPPENIPPQPEPATTTTSPAGSGEATS